MKNITLAILFISFIFIQSSQAQDVNWRALNDNSNHLASAYFGADYSSYYGVSYGYVAHNKFRPVIIGAELTIPFGKQLFDDWKGKLSLQAELWHNKHFSLAIKPGFIMRRYDSPLAKMFNTAADLTVNFGYVKPTWGLVAVAAYDKSLATYISNETLKDYYPGIRDGWYKGSGGNFKFGAKAQVSFSSWSTFLTVGKAYGENFKDNPTLPFFAELSVQKRFKK